VNDTGAGSDRVTFSISDSTVTIKDTLGGGSLQVDADGLSTVQPALTDRFLFPVDDAISFEVSQLQIYCRTGIRIRNESGDDLGGFNATPREFSTGTYTIDIESGFKIFVRIIDASFIGIYSDESNFTTPLTLSFNSPTLVFIGARSSHARPEAEITVPDDPHHVIDAISYLGSSIKEFSSERSWPTLRGYPPRIAHGEEYSVPDCLTRPDTGITISIPPTYDSIYETVPLVYYLGANVSVGSRPRLILENGYEEPLETDSESLSKRAGQLLEKCFFLDTLTRVGGYYSVPRYEYEALGSILPYYPPNLYTLSLSEQLMEYLEVSYKDIEPYIPQWPLTATLRPSFDDVHLLPHLCHSLAKIQTSSGFDTNKQYSPSTITGVTTAPSQPENVWLSEDAFENQIINTVPAAQDVTFEIVTNRSEIREQLQTAIQNDAISSPTGTAADRIVLHTEPTIEQLTQILTNGADFLYIDLPFSDGCISCADGMLNLNHVESVQSSHIIFVTSVDHHLPSLFVLLSAGAVSVATSKHSFSVRECTKIISLLQNGTSFYHSLSVGAFDHDSNIRYYGDPTAEVTTLETRSTLDVLKIRLERSNMYQIKRSAWLTALNRLGMVALSESEQLENIFYLFGSDINEQITFSASDLSKLFKESNLLLNFNSQWQLSPIDMSPSEINASVMENISASSTSNLSDPPFFDEQD